MSFSAKQRSCKSSTPVQCVRIRSSPGYGFSIFTDGFANVNCKCMTKYTKTLGSFLPNVSSDCMEANIGVEAVETEVVEVVLINQKCRFFPDCARGDHCKFLHEETPTPAVLFDGSEPEPQKRVFTVSKVVHKEEAVPSIDVVCNKDGAMDDAKEVRLYVSNIPGHFDERNLRKAAEKHGAVTEVKLLRSKVSSGRRSGFVHMLSVRQANMAIEELKKVCFTDVNGKDYLMAKVEKTLPLPKQQAKSRPSSEVDEDGFTMAKTKAKKVSKREDAPSTQQPSSFAVLLADEDLVEAVTDNPPSRKIVKEEPVKEEPVKEEWPLLMSKVVSKPLPPLEPIETEVPKLDSIRGTPPSIMASLWDERARVDNLRETLGKNDATMPKPLAEARKLALPPPVNMSSKFKSITTTVIDDDDPWSESADDDKNDDEFVAVDDVDVDDWDAEVDSWELR